MPVWIDDYQMDMRLRPQWRSLQRVVGVRVEVGCLRSEKHHRQLTGALRLSAWLPGTVFTGLLEGLQTGAHPESPLLHLPAQEPGAPTSNRAQGRHMLRSQRHPDPPLDPF